MFLDDHNWETLFVMEPYIVLEAANGERDGKLI
jgi:hypothetical protein